jgi:hypothetical protein
MLVIDKLKGKINIDISDRTLTPDIYGYACRSPSVQYASNQRATQTYDSVLIWSSHQESSTYMILKLEDDN